MSVISDYYNEKAPPFTIAQRRSRKTVPLLNEIHGKKVLDVGCASGYLGEIVRKQGNYVVGIDITRKNIVKARKILDKAFVFDVENGDVNKLGKDFDFIIMVEVIEHLFDPEIVLQRLLPVLKKNGKILLSTPNFVHIYNRLKIFAGIYEYKENTLINKSHLHFYTYQTFKKEMERLGLKLIKENHVFLPVFLERFVKYWPDLFIGQMVSVYEKK